MWWEYSGRRAVVLVRRCIIIIILHFQPEMAHLVKPVSIRSRGREKKKKLKKKKRSGVGVTMIVADVDGIIGEMGELGAGMVEGVFAA